MPNRRQLPQLTDYTTEHVNLLPASAAVEDHSRANRHRHFAGSLSETFSALAEHLERPVQHLFQSTLSDAPSPSFYSQLDSSQTPQAIHIFNNLVNYGQQNSRIPTSRYHLSGQAGFSSVNQFSRQSSRPHRFETSNNQRRQHPFMSKTVCELSCRHCSTTVCRRGMKAILLADTAVELYSTDNPPQGAQLVNEDYITASCACRIRDVACLSCGCVVGYHVTQPCQACLRSCNNGHFWMFHCTEVFSCDRVDKKSCKTLLWAHLPRVDLDPELDSEKSEIVCR